MLARSPISSYMGELPNSHGRTLTDESYIMHGTLSVPWLLYYGLWEKCCSARPDPGYRITEMGIGSGSCHDNGYFASLLAGRPDGNLNVLAQSREKVH